MTSRKKATTKPILTMDEHMTEYEAVRNPAHYGGADDPYEAVKVIRAWDLTFCLGNTVKYIRRFGSKPSADPLEDLKKARFYLDLEIAALENEP
jgi:hypothetical protein